MSCVCRRGGCVVAAGGKESPFIWEGFPLSPLSFFPLLFLVVFVSPVSTVLPRVRLHDVQPLALPTFVFPGIHCGGLTSSQMRLPALKRIWWAARSLPLGPRCMPVAADWRKLNTHPAASVGRRLKMPASTRLAA